MFSLDTTAFPLPDPRQALALADVLCRERGVRLTELRRRVLEILWNSPTPLGAYAILDVLREDGRLGAPPTVYRALDFLLEQGLIERSEDGRAPGPGKPRKLYRLTGLGRRVVEAEAERLAQLSNAAHRQMRDQRAGG